MANVSQIKLPDNTILNITDKTSGYTTNTGTVTSVGISNETNGGLSVSGSPVTSSGTISIGHSNVLTSAQSTSAVYPITIDKNGHIASYGSAVTIPTKVSDLTNDSGFITDVSDKVDKTYTLNGETSSINYNSGDGTVNITSTNSYETAQITTYNNSVSLYSATSDTDPTLSYPGGSSNIFLDWGVLTIDAIDNNVSATHFDPAIRIEPEATTIKYVVMPTEGGDAANKEYVDNSIDSIPTVPTINLNGSSTISPSFYAPTTAGTSGYYLKSNGSGAPTWAAISAGTDEKLKTSKTTSTLTYYYPVLTGTSTSAETKKYAEGLNFVMDNNSNWLTIGTSSKSGKISLLNTHEATIVPSNSMTTNTTITLPATTGTLALTSDIPTIPTNVSAFTNDAGYLTSAPVSDVTLNGSSIVSGGIADITDSSGNLTIDGSLTTGSFINLPNNISLQGYTTTGGTLNIGSVSDSNNIVLGHYASYSTSGVDNNTNIYGNNINLSARTNITLNLSTSEALYTAINTAGWTSAVIV